MKWFYVALGAALPVVLTHSVIAAPADEPAAEQSAKPQVIMLRSVDGAAGDGEHVVVKVDAEAGEGGEVVINATASPQLAVSAGPADPNRGWLGIQLAPVPPAVAAQIKTAGGTGIMVGNVIEDSPADQAGIVQYDVITAVDGKSVSDVAKLAETIGATAPGSKVTIKVLREGAETTLEATLTSRPAGEDIEWKYELSPEAEIHESIKSRAKILRRGEDGEIVLEDLGDINALQNLPDHIKDFIPKMGQFNTKVFRHDDDRSITSSVSRDGVSITVKQEGEGPIEVERTDADGNTTKATYDTPEALKAADEEAYEIYDEAHDGVWFEAGPDGMGHTFRLFTPGGAGQEQWREQMEKAMREAHEAMKGAQKSYDEARKHFQFRFNKVPGQPFFSWNDEDGTSFFGSPAGRSFRVNPDGQIEVIIRKGENEVTKVFKDEADMAARDPELHEAYTEAQAEDEE